MQLTQPCDAFGADRLTRLAQQHVGEQTAAHADLTMNPPDREGKSLLVQCELPRQDVLVHAVNQRAVQIEDECCLHERAHSASTFRLRRSNDDGASLGWSCLLMP